MEEISKPYRDFGEFLKKRFPFKVQKISLNAGFTCPNRDGTKGYGGCTYCNNQTFSPEYVFGKKSIREQLKEGVDFFSSKYPAMKYLAYFQSYTNTYGKINDLLDKYKEALSCPSVVGIIIGTRPDCMPEELLLRLQELSQDYFIMIEYGVESTSNSTLKRINRGHTYEDTKESIDRTHGVGLPTGIHLILGLPGEEREEILLHAKEISSLPVTSVKLHQLQLIRQTAMAREYEQFPERFHLYSADEYIDLCLDFMEYLNPSFYIERFVSQSPKELLIAPNWGLKNYQFTALLNKRLKERNTFQGRFYSDK